MLYAGAPAGVTAGRQRDVVDAARALNRLEGDSIDDPEIRDAFRKLLKSFARRKPKG